MFSQSDLKNKSILKKYVLSAHPILQYFIDALKISDTIGTYIKHDNRMKLPPEKTLTILLHNILSCPLPLYEIVDWISLLDEEKLNLKADEVSSLNDDRIGKALESFLSGKHKSIFFKLALQAIKLFELDCRQIHQDTTTVTFAGKYDGWNKYPLLTYGHNKDHRPDLKQLVIGYSVTADGAVPLVHEIYNGNQSDDKLHPANHQRLRKLLQRSDFIYVADCKLATDDNLKKITRYGGLFVSIMPRTWNEDEIFRKRVQQGKISWSFLLSKKINDQKNRDRYELAQGTFKTEHGYRLLWVRSSVKAQQDYEKRENKIEKVMEILRKIQIKINTYNLKTKKQIKEKVDSLLNDYHCKELVHYNIHNEIEYKRQYKKRGRPRAGDKGKLKSKRIFQLTFKRSLSGILKEGLTDGVFPLITNLKEEEYPAKKVLLIYKYQPFLEKRHSQLKTYQKIAPVYLKKDCRVIALLHIHVIALMVATLIERQLRIAMKKKKIKALPIYPEGRPCQYPTTFDIVRLFKNVERYEVIQEDSVQVFPAKLSKIQKQVLELLGVPISLYM